MLTRDLFAVADLLVCICYSQLYMSQRVLRKMTCSVVGTAGLGHVDSFARLHEVCQQAGVWMHVFG